MGYRGGIIRGFPPEWCISSMIYSGDSPFWSETLELYSGTFDLHYGHWNDDGATRGVMDITRLPRLSIEEKWDTGVGYIVQRLT